MFKETKEGQTHFENDGCGEIEHNKNILNTILKEIKEIQKTIYLDKRTVKIITDLINKKQGKKIIEKSVQCLECGKKYTSRAILIKHNKWHKRIKIWHT